MTLLADMVKTAARQEWISRLETAGVPCGPINTLDEVFDNPQVKARGMRIDLRHPGGADVKLSAVRSGCRRRPPQYGMPPPLLGQHTDEILGELPGRSADEIVALRSKGFI